MKLKPKLKYYFILICILFFLLIIVWVLFFKKNGDYTYSENKKTLSPKSDEVKEYILNDKTFNNLKYAPENYNKRELELASDINAKAINTANDGRVNNTSNSDSIDIIHNVDPMNIIDDFKGMNITHDGGAMNIIDDFEDMDITYDSEDEYL